MEAKASSSSQGRRNCSGHFFDQRTRRVQAVLFLVVPAGLNVQFSEFCLQELGVNVVEPLDQRAFLVRDHTQVSDQSIVIERVPESRMVDDITVVLSHGYDLGIASWHETWTESKGAGYWMKASERAMDDAAAVPRKEP